MRRLIDARAVDFVNYDVSEGGGVTDWKRAAGLCAAAGVRKGLLYRLSAEKPRAARR